MNKCDTCGKNIKDKDLHRYYCWDCFCKEKIEKLEGRMDYLRELMKGGEKKKDRKKEGG